MCAIIVFIRFDSLWELLRFFEFGFSPLHADVWSEDSCRRRAGLRAYLLPHRRGVKFFLRFSATVLWQWCVARVIFPCPRVRTARRVLMRYTDVQFEETKRKGILMILVPNAFFVVMFIVLAVMAVLMLRRGAVAGAVCATVAAVGCALPLVAIGLAPAAREGSMVAAAVVVAAYILTYVLTFGGAAGMFVFSRARVKAALAVLGGEGE